MAVDELEPLAAQPPLADRFRIITYDRRGYGASTSIAGPGSIARDAADALAVLDAFDTASAHVLGVSFSAAIALELAILAPDRVRSLILIEPPPSIEPGAAEFRGTSRRLMELHEREGTSAALGAFMPLIAGPNWRAEYDRVVPGMSERIERDAEAFFGTDMPALIEWRVEPDRTSAVTCPVLHISGGDSGPRFANVPGRVRTLLPQAESVPVEGAGHDVAFTHPEAVAAEVARFLSR
nr:alpha/beta hydrolase [Brevibacterium daeguense]